MLKINIQQAIDQVDEKYWSNQKNGKLTKKNAKVFGKYYGLNKLLNDVATENVRNFKVHCKNVLKYQNGTINTKLASLSKLCTYARGLKGFKFTWGVPLIEYESVNNQREFVLNADLEKKLLTTAKDMYKYDESDLWECLILTGCRVSELLNLTWDNVQDDFLNIVDTKNGEDRYVPIFDEVKAILNRRRKMKLARPFPLSIHSVEWAWKQVRKKLGLSDEKDFVMHSLRHTYITRLLNKKVGIEVVQKIAGHKDIRITQRYNHPTKDDIRNAIKDING